jgi:hypothetical protein
MTGIVTAFKALSLDAQTEAYPKTGGSRMTKLLNWRAMRYTAAALRQRLYDENE